MEEEEQEVAPHLYMHHLRRAAPPQALPVRRSRPTPHPSHLRHAWRRRQRRRWPPPQQRRLRPTPTLPCPLPHPLPRPPLRTVTRGRWPRRPACPPQRGCCRRQRPRSPLPPLLPPPRPRPL